MIVQCFCNVAQVCAMFAQCLCNVNAGMNNVAQCHVCALYTQYLQIICAMFANFMHKVYSKSLMLTQWFKLWNVWTMFTQRFCKVCSIFKQCLHNVWATFEQRLSNVLNVCTKGVLITRERKYRTNTFAQCLHNVRTEGNLLLTTPYSY
jgi:hypothetical protein